MSIATLTPVVTRTQIDPHYKELVARADEAYQRWKESFERMHVNDRVAVNLISGVVEEIRCERGMKLAEYKAQTERVLDRINEALTLARNAKAHEDTCFVLWQQAVDDRDAYTSSPAN